METVFFSIFRRLLPVTVFLRLVETPISTKSSILAGGNGFSGYWELFFFFVHKFFLPVETVKEISERQFLKKKHIVTNVTDFLLSGNHFLRFSQTGVNCCHWKRFAFKWNIFFSQSFIPAGENEFLVNWKQYCSVSSFFLLVETIIETWGKSIFEDEIC